MLAYGILSLLIPLATGPVLVAVSFLLAAQLLGDVAIEIYLVNEVSLRQAIIPPRLLGRANASMQVLSEGAGPLGALLAGALGQSLGLRWTLLIGVLGIMLASLWIFRAQTNLWMLALCSIPLVALFANGQDVMLIALAFAGSVSRHVSELEPGHAVRLEDRASAGVRKGDDVAEHLVDWLRVPLASSWRSQRHGCWSSRQNTSSCWRR